MLKSFTRIKPFQFATRGINNQVNRQLVPLQNGLVPNTTSPWKPQTDPNGSGLVYWWNPETNETTHLGSPRPNHWIEVQDPVGSSLTYWWDPETNQTTQLGAPRPHFLPTIQQPQQAFPPVQQVSFGKHMIHMVGMGFGMTMGLMAIRVLLGF
jgi:hypothetical protein